MERDRYQSTKDRDKSRKPAPLSQKREESGELDTASRYVQFTRPSLSFHPISCGTALFGHVTSGETCTASGIGHTGDRVTLARILLSVSRWTYRVDSCSMGLTILSALVRDVVNFIKVACRSIIRLVLLAKLFS